MAGWSILIDGSALECVEIWRKFQSNGFCVDPDGSLKEDFDGGKAKLRCLFDQILYVFLKEISIGEEIRPLPAMLGDGRRVDLFKLFWVVRRKGGYDCVSKNGLWASVAEESGLGPGVTSSLKLIYIKYLDMLDRWLQRIFRDKGISDSGTNLGLLPMELETEFKGLFPEMSDTVKKDEEHTQMDSEKNGHLLSATGNFNDMHEVRIVMESDCGEKCVDDNAEIVILDQSVDQEDLYSRKRKRECLSGILNWVTEVAKNPGDSAIGTLPEGSKWKECKGKEFWVQALLAREALFVRWHKYSTAEQSLFQKRQKMHPTMYEGHIDGNYQSTERLRCSQRLRSLKKSHSSISATQSDLEMSQSSCMSVQEKHRDKRSLSNVDSLAASKVDGMFWDNQVRKHVAVGTQFQAEVPDWTGVPSESDSKWLGVQVWPPETGESNFFFERDPIGKGRQDSCDCRLPGSVECVRFHIAEKRMRLKVELGSVFHHWRFNYMGEEVSLSWSVDEEKRFKAVVRLNPPSVYNYFWDQVFRCFPSKKRSDLVSYYFNVFLLQQRSYQNRVTPNSIDSDDDDESEFGSESNGFGHEAVKVSSSKSAFCAKNKQFIDLEEQTLVD